MTAYERIQLLKSLRSTLKDLNISPTSAFETGLITETEFAILRKFHWACQIVCNYCKFRALES